MFWVLDLEIVHIGLSWLSLNPILGIHLLNFLGLDTLGEPGMRDTNILLLMLGLVCISMDEVLIRAGVHLGNWLEVLFVHIRACLRWETFDSAGMLNIWLSWVLVVDPHGIHILCLEVPIIIGHLECLPLEVLNTEPWRLLVRLIRLTILLLVNFHGHLLLGVGLSALERNCRLLLVV